MLHDASVHCHGIAVCLEKDQSRIDSGCRKDLHNCTMEKRSPGLPQLQLVGGRALVLGETGRSGALSGGVGFLCNNDSNAPTILRRRGWVYAHGVKVETPG